MTKNIIEFASPDNYPIYGIDPAVKSCQDYKNYILIQKPSHEGLRDVPECDVYFIDGDHNYYTVKGELDRIKKIPASAPMFPLLFVHDVGWPGDRRDSYYLPSHVPDDYRRKADSGLGADPTLPGLGEFGIAAGNPDYVYANDRGGAKNGVLTAVEDFVQENPVWRYVAIPGAFGLGIVYKKAGSESLVRKIAELETAVSWLGEEISILEYNRLQLLCESYRAHHYFLMTTEELSAKKSKNTDLERELMEAYRSRDEYDVRVEEFRSKNADLERELMEACRSRDEYDVRVEEFRSKNADLERELMEACQSSEEAHRLAEEANARADAQRTYCEAITGGWSFRIGRLITFPARRVKLLFK